ncbi:MraY family glycosyltransferase [Pedobacter cryoconitis]|uniref:UDP-N-acetylmuramyl pentapeptide phosphotransferase/UDP-N-acetylglucosamine-1-phosphate transferase n=1 Tax=Pedobacter cryoconitis TaxID=188932 RepID=A0A7X0J6Y4_9SPHI|nr:MraY family glycosyltransferase [Pedobacter cryoconitis]MBB6500982.1 UDP-N-acetylmuramyl pentapeptide phosphotransferase/UDP-N-acetylglucosamine-1-phosphate transferase [Pedobacter cryoconitis]
MRFLIVVIPFLIAVSLGRIITPLIMLVTYKRRLFDPVNSRKLHKNAIPRLGGVAFFPVQCFLFALTVIVVYKVKFVALNVDLLGLLPMFLSLMCGLFLLFIVGIGDDLIGVNYKWKFFNQIIAACLLPASGLWINDLYGLFFITHLSPWVGIPITIFVIVLVLNAVNLIDGLDGLCSGLIGIGTLVLGGLFIYYGAWIHGLFSFITAGVLLPFFYFNVFGTARRQRRIFMGDTGSLTLGFSIVFLALSFATNNQAIKPFSDGAIIVAFSPLIIPVLDVARVMCIRWRTGAPLFKPDRNHLHHKLLRAGVSHRNAMISIIALSLGFCVLNIVSVQYMSNNLIVLCNVLLWTGFLLVFSIIEKYKKKTDCVDSKIILFE